APRSTLFPYTTLFRSKQFGCRRIGLLHFLKREQPGGRDRGRIVDGLLSASSEQSVAMVLINFKVISEAASCFFNIGPCLVECQRSEEHTSELQSREKL